VKKKSKTDRTLHFLSRIAESAFKEKFENMFEKLLKNVLLEFHIRNKKCLLNARNLMILNKQLIL